MKVSGEEWPLGTGSRRRLPIERAARTHHFEIRPSSGGANVKGYITTGEYTDGRLGEVFVKVRWASQPDVSLGPWIDSVCTAVSVGLQYGIGLDIYADKFVHQRFEPSGFVVSGEESIHTAKSVLDYVFRWLQLRYPSGVRV